MEWIVLKLSKFLKNIMAKSKKTEVGVVLNGTPVVRNEVSSND